MTANSFTNGDICFGTLDTDKNCVIAIKSNGNFYKVSPEPGADTNKYYPLVNMGSERKPDYSSILTIKKLNVYGTYNSDDTSLIKIYGAQGTNNTQVEGITLHGGIAATTGPKESYIKIGNSNGPTTTTGSSANDINNRYGALYLYSQRCGCNIIKARSNLIDNVTFWLPDNGGSDKSAYAVWVDRPNSTLQVGSTNYPVYIDNNGMVVQCGSILGTASGPFETIHSQGYAIYGKDNSTNTIFEAGSLKGESSSTGDVASMLTLGTNQNSDNKLKNRYGAIKLYSLNKNFSVIKNQNDLASNIYFMLPKTGKQESSNASDPLVSYAAWIAKTDSSLKVGSSTQPVYVEEDGELTPITSLSPTYGGTGLVPGTTQANKLYYYTVTDGVPAWNSSNHYIDQNKISINTSTFPTTGVDDSCKLYVNGGAYLHGGSLTVDTSQDNDKNIISFDTKSMYCINTSTTFDLYPDRNTAGFSATTAFYNDADLIQTAFSVTPFAIMGDIYNGGNSYNAYFTFGQSGVYTWLDDEYNGELTGIDLTASHLEFFFQNNSDSMALGISPSLYYVYTSDGGHSSLEMDTDIKLGTDTTTGKITLTSKTIEAVGTLAAKSSLIVDGASTFKGKGTFEGHVGLVAQPVSGSRSSYLESANITYTLHTTDGTSISWYTPIQILSTKQSVSDNVKGAAVCIGAGGPTIIGGGESATTYLNTLKKKAGSNRWDFPNTEEEIYVTSDGDIHLLSQCGSTEKTTIDGTANTSYIKDGTMRTVKVHKGTICVESDWGYGTADPSTNSNTSTGVQGQIYFKLIS